MKQLILLFLTLSLNIFLNGQTKADKQIVIQKAVDFEALQPYYSNVEFEGKKQMFIVDNGVIPNCLKLLKYGNEIVFMSKEDMFFKNIRNHLDFSVFTIDDVVAEVKFRYGIKGPHIHLKFEKDNGVWNITESELNN